MVQLFIEDTSTGQEVEVQVVKEQQNSKIPVQTIINGLIGIIVCLLLLNVVICVLFTLATLTLWFGALWNASYTMIKVFVAMVTVLASILYLLHRKLGKAILSIWTGIPWKVVQYSILLTVLSGLLSVLTMVAFWLTVIFWIGILKFIAWSIALFVIFIILVYIIYRKWGDRISAALIKMWKDGVQQMTAQNVNTQENQNTDPPSNQNPEFDLSSNQNTESHSPPNQHSESDSNLQSDQAPRADFSSNH